MERLKNALWQKRIDMDTSYGTPSVLLQVVSNDDTDHPEDSVAAMRERVAAGELAGPFLRDGEQSAAQAYGVTATPETRPRSPTSPRCHSPL